MSTPGRDEESNMTSLRKCIALAYRLEGSKGTLCGQSIYEYSRSFYLKSCSFDHEMAVEIRLCTSTR